MIYRLFRSAYAGRRVVGIDRAAASLSSRACCAGGTAAGMHRALRDLDELSQPITDVEADGKGLPILLRQYAKIGGKLLGFNVDRKFSGQRSRRFWSWWICDRPIRRCWALHGAGRRNSIPASCTRPQPFAEQCVMARSFRLRLAAAGRLQAQTCTASFSASSRFCPTSASSSGFINSCILSNNWRSSFRMWADIRCPKADNPVAGSVRASACAKISRSAAWSAVSSSTRGTQLCELVSGREQHVLFCCEVKADFALKNLRYFRLPRGQVGIGDR